jgi:general L-amino acid transport system permease protein
MTATRVDTLEPIPVPEPEGPPRRHFDAREWARENLFSSRVNTILTVVFGLLLVWIVYRVTRFALVDARWEIIQRNVKNLMVFQFPSDQLWRVWAALYVLAATVGFGVGVAGTRRALLVETAGEAKERVPRSFVIRRIAPLLALVAVLLVFARSLTATLLVAGVAAVAVAFRLLGRRVPPRRLRLAAVGILAGIILAYAVVVAFDGVPRDRWGGFLLTVFLAVGGILLSFPLGVLLALGRRSTLPAVRLVCTVYIELIRGVPLITLLFMSAFALGFFLPPGTERPSAVTRALVALVLFTAAYVAEIVRGGLQGVPRGQIEASQALGLSPVKTTRMIVLPQALRSVIPALVGQFISLFKDTSLVFIVGLSELLAVAQNITKQPDFVAQGLFVETLVFAAFVYWAGSYWMSRESQRLEQRLGVGVR